MKKIISFFAYLWAALGTIIILAVFIGMGGWQQLAMRLPFMRVDPVFTGGTVVDTLQVDSVMVLVHEPVFPGLFSEGDEGFVQIDVRQCPTDTLRLDSLPVAGNVIALSLTPASAMANDLSVTEFARISDGWIVRLELKKLD